MCLKSLKEARAEGYESCERGALTARGRAGCARERDREIESQRESARESWRPSETERERE